ncbi:Ff.00g106520.m01.CDS01 [Fusarium sp. VM40]|nr:Ff.00g106520.m01.CDS01 [Fusarium sp. VM40]
MNFQFINNESTNNPGSRKAIRSHVMKGKNTGRIIQGRGRRHAVPLGGDFFKDVHLAERNEDVVDADGSTLIFPEVTLIDTTHTPNNPFAGEEYTYFSFPVQFTSSMRYSVYEFNTSICNVIYPYAFCRPTEEIGSPWFKFMVADPACLHCLLAMTVTYLNIMSKSERPVESLEATRHFTQTLRLLNPRLSQPSAAKEDANVAIIISLAIHSNLTQDLHASAMHLDALQRLLGLRPGGISGIRECNRPLVQKICRTDVELAVAQGTRPRFSDAGLTAVAAGPTSARRLAYPLNQTSQLLQRVTRELLALCRRPGRTKMAALQYQDVLISMWQRLVEFAPLGGTRPRDLLDDVWQLALLAFLVTVKWSTSYLRALHCKLLHELLREHVESRAMVARGAEYRSLWLWIVFVYALSLPDDERRGTLGEIRGVARELGISEWGDLKTLFKPFPWIGIVHDVTGQSLWELAMGDDSIERPCDSEP